MPSIVFLRREIAEGSWEADIYAPRYLKNRVQITGEYYLHLKGVNINEVDLSYLKKMNEGEALACVGL